jgi:hypothetical protein
MNGINASHVNSGPYATLYSPTLLQKLPFGSGVGNCVSTDKRAIVESSEKHVRTSTEYRQWIATLHQDIGLNRCAVLGNISSNDAVSIEMHHFPLSLFDLCWGVAGRQKNDAGRFSSATIADEVLGLHFTFNVGVVPLCTTIHQLHHSDKLPLSLQMTWGNWQSTYQALAPYVPRSVHTKIDHAGRLTSQQVAEIAVRALY